MTDLGRFGLCSTLTLSGLGLRLSRETRLRLVWRIQRAAKGAFHALFRFCGAVIIGRFMVWQGTTNCIFCGKTPTTREHVFPKWSHRYIQKVPGKYRMVSGIEHTTHRDVKVGKGKGDIHDWQVKCVCGGTDDTCNSGWMRKRLEDRARPILEPLITGATTTISPQQQRIIAGWAALKAIVGEYEQPHAVSWSDAERGRMMRIQLPPSKDCHIWIGHYVRGKDWLGFWNTYPFSAFPRARDKHRHGEPTTEFNSFATTQILGHLLIHVVHGPLLSLFKKTRVLPIETEKMAMIWPVGKQVCWPLETLSDRDAQEIATGMFRDVRAAALRALAKRGHNTALKS